MKVVYIVTSHEYDAPYEPDLSILAVFTSKMKAERYAKEMRSENTLRVVDVEEWDIKK